MLVELDPHVAPAGYRGLLPAGLLYLVADPRAVLAVLDGSFAAQRDAQARVHRRLGSLVREQETSRQLLQVHYMDALYYAALSARSQSLHALAQALALYPQDTSLRALQVELESGRGPVAVDALLEQATGESR
jgi:hypothetical protein